MRRGDPKSRPTITVTEGRVGDLYGWCNEWTGEVRLRPGMTPRQRLGTLLHEGLHVALPRTAEREIARLTGLLTSLLWREGYRRSTRGGLGRGDERPRRPRQ